MLRGCFPKGVGRPYLSRRNNWRKIPPMRKVVNIRGRTLHHHILRLNYSTFVLLYQMDVCLGLYCTASAKCAASILSLAVMYFSAQSPSERSLLHLPCS